MFNVHDIEKLFIWEFSSLEQKFYRMRYSYSHINLFGNLEQSLMEEMRAGNSEDLLKKLALTFNESVI